MSFMSNRYINPSGFAENLPAEQLVENKLKEAFRNQAELYGYVPLETSAVEYMDTLASKGDINKEIYTIGRALGEGEAAEGERGLHFDLTVPFARYVAQNQGELSFPFRRYQMQKVWRGERPQKGRFREFYQADIDVVGQQNLPIQFDAEVATVMARVLTSFGISAITMHINNRKLLCGLIESCGMGATPEVLQLIDKTDKIGVDEVVRLLGEEHQVAEESARGLFEKIGQSVSQSEVENYLNGIETSSELLEEGVNELREVFTSLPQVDGCAFVLNPQIARGLDYYTGTVYETTVDGYEKYGSICSGGRYADLAGRFTNQELPGVGLSIGLTRLLSIIKGESLLDFSKKSTSDVMMCLLDDSMRGATLTAADELRQTGKAVEMNQKSSVALGKQLDLAEARGIPYAVVCEQDANYTLYRIGGEKEVFDSLDALKRSL